MTGSLTRSTAEELIARGSLEGVSMLVHMFCQHGDGQIISLLQWYFKGRIFTDVVLAIQVLYFHQTHLSLA